jgi:C1A family cysteine protease
MGLNEFADCSEEELNKLLTPLNTSRRLLEENPPKLVHHKHSIDEDEDSDAEEDAGSGPDSLGASLPSFVDWRQSGAVTSVKKQGGCNGCYAFATAAAVEGLYKIRKGTLYTFSP